MSRTSISVALFLVLVSSAPLFACLWDSDTLQMERLRFPGVLEIITGKFVRHSRAYYEWRIGDRKKKLEAKPNDPALIDDLAVAYAKLGRPAEGIPLLDEVLKEHPDRYETLSNLGTLLFFANRLDDSKTYIRRALEINPDAHFGREKYQLLLTEYLQQSEYSTAGVMQADRGRGFANWILKGRNYFDRDTSEKERRMMRQEVKDAVKGVLGMLHFADHESPILLEALGDLLRHGDDDENVMLLASRAYLRAAQFSPNQSAAAYLHQAAETGLSNFLQPLSLEGIQEELTQEVEAAKNWAAKIEANERSWIDDGKDVDREFAAVYYESFDKEIASVTAALQREKEDQDRELAKWKSEWHKNQSETLISSGWDFFYYYCFPPLVLFLLVATCVYVFSRISSRSVRPETAESTNTKTFE